MAMDTRGDAELHTGVVACYQKRHRNFNQPV